jgi:hypothetical protein
MMDWARANVQAVLLAAAALTVLATSWLAVRTGRRGSAGLTSHVAFPLLLAGLTLCCLPALLPVCGVAPARYPAALEGVWLRALWLGLLLDQTSWAQRTTHGLHGRRSVLPLLVWGLGILILVLATVVARSQASAVTFLQRALTELGMRYVDGNVVSGLLTDWGPCVARSSLAMTLVGACALATQAFLWLLRIAHAYVFMLAVEPGPDAVPSHAPGRFQSLFGVLFGSAGTAWLVWATFALLRG